MMKKNAFSLIELLVSLIIISLIAAAFVPMLTKNIKHKELALATKSASLDCAEFDAAGRCLMCSKDTGCSLCTTQLEALEGKYVYPPDGCDYKNCAVGCKTCDKDRCIVCKENYELAPDKKSCKKNWIYPSIENCARVDSIFIPAAYNAGKDVCVTKRNMGDLGTLQIPATAGVTIKNAIGGSCTYKCCWTGNTAARSCNNISGFDYSGCNRTGCDFDAANAICANFHYGNGITEDNWRLPKQTELKAWVNNINAVSKNKGVQGLQLCDHNSGYGSPRCLYRTGDCPTTSGACRIHHLTGAPMSHLWLESGVAKFGGIGAHDYGESVRCVIEKYKK